jgi:hypothetical protein
MVDAGQRLLARLRAFLAQASKTSFGAASKDLQAGT